MTTATLFHQPLLLRIERLTNAANEFAEIYEANPEAFVGWYMSTGNSTIFLNRQKRGVGDAKKLAKVIGGTWTRHQDFHWICTRWPGVEVWIRHTDKDESADEAEVDLDA